MQSTSVRWAGFMALAALVLLGCGRSPTRPENEALVLTLTLSSRSGDPTHPIRLRAEIRNAGRSKVTFAEGYGFRLLVRDPEGHRMGLQCHECPDMLCLAEPGRMFLLAAGQVAATEFPFSGVVTECGGDFEGSSGTYEVEAMFAGWTAESQRVGLFKVDTFLWSAGAD